MQVSKSQFKARALEFFREVESSGEPLIITDNGRPALEIRPYTPTGEDPRKRLKGSVLGYEQPTEPIEPDAWESGT